MLFRSLRPLTASGVGRRTVGCAREKDHTSLRTSNDNNADGPESHECQKSQKAMDDVPLQSRAVSLSPQSPTVRQRHTSRARDVLYRRGLAAAARVELGDLSDTSIPSIPTTYPSKTTPHWLSARCMENNQGRTGKLTSIPRLYRYGMICLRRPGWSGRRRAALH
jgi:hypothetical protein